MKKKATLLAILYYPIVMLLCAGFFFGISALLHLSEGADNLGAVIAVTYGTLFVGFPVLVCVMMRFSLLRWLIDPFAAACCPVFLYVVMLGNELRRNSHGLSSAFRLLNRSLSDDGGMGWFFFAGLFLLGLIASVSFARRNGNSLPFRLLGLKKE